MSISKLSPGTASSLEFLAGGGEMGERIRNFNWSKTPLGTFESWPQSLKTCVRIMLTSPQPMFVWWGEQLINIYNDAYRFVLGTKHPQALGVPGNKTWKEIWDVVGKRAEIVFSQNEGTFDEGLLLIMNRNGYDEETYFKFSYNPVPGDNGETQGLFCACTDETERVISERQLSTLALLSRETTQAGSEQDIFLRTIETLKQNPHDFPYAVIYKATDNGNKLELVASTSDELFNKFPREIDVKNAKKKESTSANSFMRNEMIVSEYLKERYGALPGGAWSKSPDAGISIPIIHGSQKIPYGVLQIGMNPFQRLDERYTNFFNLIAGQVASAISIVNSLEDERKRAEALAEIDKAKTTFFSNISHEFRTPITLILGPLEELINKPMNNLTPKEYKGIETSHRNAMRLLKLVNTLLDFSRIESGKQNVNYTLTNIVSYTVNLAANFRSVIEKAGLQFHIRADAVVQPVYVDQEMWEKIVFNLLSNAFKYTLKGNITLSIFPEKDHAVLMVADTGVGIPEKELPHMFERFHRIQNSTGRTYEGTGIGLSLTKELVNLHGGEISVSSKEGEGSRFTVTIPFGKAHLKNFEVSEKSPDVIDVISNVYVEEATTLLDSSEEKQDETSKEPELRSVTVLVADDNADMREYLRMLLEKKYQVITASNGMDALHKIHSNPPHLVVSDVMMPILDGIQLLKELKKNPDTSHIPVILLTARAGEESRIEGFEIGADDYLAKPFSAKELLTRISSQISRNKPRE